eukprot:TRINITY_DN9854_c0_g1_i2.p1 TRINITY_DN9854_c0_g1~~TRINITY_DN9854_c0_g1_i2.p1  ORF type:complete len:571 (-),score=73.99 TRINITY_DN9854_c0_g1_i2:6-1517(-)
MWQRRYDDPDKRRRVKREKASRKRKLDDDDAPSSKPTHMWFWKGEGTDGSSKWFEFEDDVCVRLEKALKDGKSILKTDDKRYVDLSDPDSFVLRRYDDPDKKRGVKREKIRVRARSASPSPPPAKKARKAADSDDDDVKKPTAACKHAEACTDKTEAHRAKYTHPCQYGADCFRQGNPKHANSESHPCPRGVSCRDFIKKDDEHCAKFSHPAVRKPCRDGEKCTQQDETLYPDHLARYVHPCGYGAECNFLKNPGDAKNASHMRKLLHPCPLGKDCLKQKDETHLSRYTHDFVNPKFSAAKGLLPPHWDPWDHTKQNELLVELVGVPKYRKEHDEVVAHLRKTGVRVTQITSLRRVQNFRLWLQYWSARERVQGRPINARKEVEINWVFHGCRTTANMDDIITNGFDQQRANSMPYGVWFAQEAPYSWNGGYAIAHPDGTRELIMASVIIGTPGDDDGSGRRAFVKGKSGEIADCQTHKQGATTVYVVYRPDQCYPSYIIRGK